MNASADRPLIVGIGGSTRPASATERALLLSLKAAESVGARTIFFGGLFLAKLPIFEAESNARTLEQESLVEAVRGASGLIVATPGYHGGVSGLVKNSLDLLEDLREDNRCYLDGRAVGCIVTAFGWQTCGSTLAALRSIVHALRGWPTPLGASLNTAQDLFDEEGNCLDDRAATQLRVIGHQVMEFARRFSA